MQHGQNLDMKGYLVHVYIWDNVILYSLILFTLSMKLCLKCHNPDMFLFAARNRYHQGQHGGTASEGGC